MLQRRRLSFHLRIFCITTTLCPWSCYLIFPCLCLAIQWGLMLVPTSGLEGLNELMQMKCVELCLTHTNHRIKWSVIWERKKMHQNLCCPVSYSQITCSNSFTWVLMRRDLKSALLLAGDGGCGRVGRRNIFFACFPEILILLAWVGARNHLFY